MTTLFTYSIRALLTTTILLGLFAQDALPQTTTLASLLERIESHPELAMKRAEVEAAESRIPMRSSLMEPKLILGVQNVPTSSFSFREDPMTAKVFGIEQMLPYPGKLGKERTIGEASVKIAQANVDERRNMLRRDVKLAWYEILHNQRSIDVNLRHVKLLDDFKEEIAVNVAYGKSSIAQLDQLELEQTEVEQMIAGDSAMIAMQKARILYITGVDISQISQTDSLQLVPFPYSLEQLMQEARAHSPRLAAIRAAILQSVTAIERAKLESYPDFDFMLMYMQRDELPSAEHGAPPMSQSDMFSAQISVNLPFIDYGGTRNAMVAEMEAMRNMQLAEEEMIEREIRMMLAEKLIRLEELRRKHELFAASVLPSLDTRIRLFLTEYQFDKTSLQSAISQILDFLHKQHEVFEVESEYRKAVAEIEYVIGKDVM